jgi:hypothetical protein
MMTGRAASQAAGNIRKRRVGSGKAGGKLPGGAASLPFKVARRALARHI